MKFQKRNIISKHPIAITNLRKGTNINKRQKSCTKKNTSQSFLLIQWNIICFMFHFLYPIKREITAIGLHSLDLIAAHLFQKRYNKTLYFAF